jgi:hypothetical protein
MSYFYHTNIKTAEYAFSHYSDPAFDGNGAIIFGHQVDGLRWEYDDRLEQYDPEKHESAWEAAVAECGNRRTARRIERYLQLYFDDPSIEIVAIRTGTRPFDGYPWHVYGFKQHPQDANKQQ